MNLKIFLILIMIIQVFTCLSMNKERIINTNIVLTFDKSDFSWKTWSLHSNNAKYNKELNVVVEGFEAEEKKKSLVAALHLFYTRLAHHIFDVSALEDVFLGKFTYSFLPVPKGAEFCESKLLINGTAIHPIIVTQCISANIELDEQKKMIALGVNSTLLPRLKPSDAEEYKKTLLGLSDTLLSPIIQKDTKTRQIYLDQFANFFLALSKKYDWDKKEKSAKTFERESKDFNKFNASACKKLKIVGLLCGLSVGFNLGLMSSYLFKDYFKNHPQYALSLLGLSSLLGLGSCAVSQFLR